MPDSRRAITSRVTVQNPRPRKYASAAEKQAAFRARFPTLCVRVEPKTAETVQAVADASGRTQQETLLSMLKYAMTNRNWLTLGLTEHKQLPRIEEPRKENPTMKRKPTPAQIAARERFAAMARSGAFKKKATKAKAKPKRNPIERYELRRLDKTNALDSTYKTLTHAKSALDEIDRPPASFYVIDTETGKPHFSFQAQTKFPHIEIRGTAMQKAYKSNPRASNPIILVNDKAIASKRKANPVKRRVMKEKRPFYYVVKVGQSYDGQFLSTHYSLDDVMKIAQQKADKYGAQAKITEFHS